MATPQTFGVELPAAIPPPTTGNPKADAAIAKLMLGAPNTYSAATCKAAEKAGEKALVALLTDEALTAGEAPWLDEAKQKAMPSEQRRAYKKLYDAATRGKGARLAYLGWLVVALAKSAKGRARLLEAVASDASHEARELAARALLESGDLEVLRALADAANPAKWDAENPHAYKVYTSGAAALFRSDPDEAYKRFAPLLRKSKKEDDVTRAMAILYGLPVDGTAVDPRFVEVLVPLLGHEDLGYSAVSGLNALPPDPAVIEPVLKLMGKDPKKLSGLFTQELRLLSRVAGEDPRVYDYLVGGLHHSWMNFRVAFEGLGNAGRPEGVNVIREWLVKNSDTPKSERMVLAKRIIAKLEKLGPVPPPAEPPKAKAKPAPVKAAPATRLEFKEGTSAKFWELSVDGKTVTTRWGRIGTTGQSKVEELANPSSARTSGDRQLEEKLKKGYVQVSGPGAAAATGTATKIDVKLEQRVHANPDDESNYLVLADALSEASDPRGELISVQHALSKSPKDKKLKSREAALLQGLGLPEEDLATFGWKWGFAERVYLHHTKDWMNNEFDSVGLARQVFALPVCSNIEELQLGVLRWEFQEEDAPAVLKEAARQGWAPRLKRLRLGHLPDDDIDLAHHPVGDLAILSKAFPALQSLFIHAGAFSLAPLNLPALRELTIETCGLSKKILAALLKSTLPSLEKLVLWFGSDNYGADVGAAQLKPLLDGNGFERVKHLGLMNAEFTDALCELLPDSKLLKQLQVLDLSMGTMTDKGALALAKKPGAFKHLRELNVDDNFLEDEGKKALKALACPVVSKDQKLAEEENHRYVTVGE